MAKKTYLDRQAIFDAQDLSVEDVDVPEWGGTVRVRTLTGAERDAFEATIMERKGDTYEANMENMRAKLAAFSIVDEAGERIFSEQDIQELSKKSASALQRVFNVASRLSGISPEDVEELAKKSESAPKGASGSV